MDNDLAKGFIFGFMTAIACGVMLAAILSRSGFERQVINNRGYSSERINNLSGNG